MGEGPQVRKRKLGGGSNNGEEKASDLCGRNKTASCMLRALLLMLA